MALIPDTDSAARIRSVMPQEAQFRAESIGQELNALSQKHLQDSAAAFAALAANNATFKNCGIYGMGATGAEKSQLADMLKVYSAAETHDVSHFPEKAPVVQNSKASPQR